MSVPSLYDTLLSLIVCDWATMFEDGGLGAVAMAIVWGLWNWFKHRGSTTSVTK